MDGTQASVHFSRYQWFLKLINDVDIKKKVYTNHCVQLGSIHFWVFFSDTHVVSESQHLGAVNCRIRFYLKLLAMLEFRLHFIQFHIITLDIFFHLWHIYSILVYCLGLFIFINPVKMHLQRDSEIMKVEIFSIIYYREWNSMPTTWKR